MDAEERVRLRELLADTRNGRLPVVANADVLALLDALTAAEAEIAMLRTSWTTTWRGRLVAERDAARAEATRLRECAVKVADDLEWLRGALASWDAEAISGADVLLGEVEHELRVATEPEES